MQSLSSFRDAHFQSGDDGQYGHSCFLEEDDLPLAISCKKTIAATLKTDSWCAEKLKVNVIAIQIYTSFNFGILKLNII